MPPAPNRKKPQHLRLEVKNNEIQLHYKEQMIPVRIDYSRRRTMGLTITREPLLVVKMPLHQKFETAHKLVTNKLTWIEKHLLKWEKIQPFTAYFSYTDGEKHLFLGKEYPLEVLKGDTLRVGLVDDKLQVHMPDLSQSHLVEELVHYFYRKQAERFISERSRMFMDAHIPKPIHGKIRFRFSRMKSRWGSCARNFRISFNTELMRAPVEAIDYVIAHEFCHLDHANHGPDFYEKLTEVMPDWLDRRKMLERISLRY